jgi:cytochrome P450
MRVMRLRLDEASKCWIHSDPRAARVLLEHPELTVRPVGELVPRALVDTALGEIWSRWARMNDGPRHATLRARIDALLAPWDDAAVTAATERALTRLLRTYSPRGRTLDALLEALPVTVIAELLGFPVQLHPEVVSLVRLLVQATAPGAPAETVARADVATRRLLALVESHLHPPDLDQTASIVALWWQSADSMVGLVGNAVLALVLRPQPGRAASLVSLDWSPPALLTRRYAPAPLEVCGEQLGRGACVRVSLDAAVAFGAGPHRCPGERLARLVCDVAAPRIVSSREDWPSFEPRYRASHNARLPSFAEMEPS